MRVDKIIFVQTFPTGPYQNQKLGMEIIIDPHDFMDGEVPQITVAKDAFEFAKKAVTEAFNAMNPGLNIEVNPEHAHQLYNGTPGSSFQPIPSLDYKAKERVEILIENAIDETELSNYANGAAEYGLTTQYMDKLKSLTK